MGLSTHGGSAKVLRELEAARRGGLLTVGVPGNCGGAMAGPPSAASRRPVRHAVGVGIQEAQTTVYQVLWKLAQVPLATCTP
jgi:phosphoheptose isomerase